MEIVEAFNAVLEAEAEETKAKEELGQAKLRLNGAEATVAEAWKRVEAILAETGEYEILIPGKVTDFRVGYLAKPRMSVKVENPDAVPDEFVKIERKPKLKEIGDYLKAVDAPPNWARFEAGEKKLTWKTVKKS